MFSILKIAVNQAACGIIRGKPQLTFSVNILNEKCWSPPSFLQLKSFYSSYNIQLNIKTQQCCILKSLTSNTLIMSMSYDGAKGLKLLLSGAKNLKFLFYYRKFWNYLTFTHVQVWLLLWNGVSPSHSFYPLSDEP